jgi:Raf kinase inhibitor-like YbhB/YbcL family protein
MMTRKFAAGLALLALAGLTAGNALAQGFRLPPLLVESKAFEDGGIVPAKFSFAGGNIQPDFKITNAPEGTVAYAIIFHDIDVALGGNTDDVLHWVAWNIPATAGATQIPEGKLPEGSVQGKNIRGQNNFMGSGAPPGPRYHHYVFEFYALSSKLDLPDTGSRNELLAAMKGKVVAKSAYVGRFRGTAPPAGAPAAAPARPANATAQ